MSSEKLRKYLAYYQKVLNADPENIEARLRLAAIFREMGRTSHAVEEYVTASKLLAKEGLPWEAIAACKAVLELEPDHSEIKYFLARLFALVPEAMGTSSRIAQPLDSTVIRSTPVDAQRAISQDATITLREPKLSGDTTRHVDVEEEDVWAHEKPTQNRWIEADSLATEPTHPLDDDEDAAGAREEVEEDDETSPLDSDLIPEFDGPDVTKEMDPVNLDEKTPAQLPSDAVSIEDRNTRPIRPMVRPVDDKVASSTTFETFEVNVFDMESLGLDESSEIDLAFLENFDGEVSDFAADEVSETYPAVYKVAREELPEIPLLSKLPPDVFMRLLGVIDLQRVPAKTIILRPGHSSRTLFIVVRGHARVTREVAGQEVELATMDEGDFFGEFMLLTGRTGAATVRADSDCELLAIHESVVNDIADEHPEIWDVLWDFYYARMLNNLLASSEIFRPLDMDERQRLAEKFEMQEVVADEVFLHEGDPCRDLYLVLNGEVRAERHVSGSVQELATMREGEFFGLASSLNDEPYLADLRAMRDTTLLMLPSQEFRDVTDSHPEVNTAVERAIMSRRALNDAFTSGITAYAEHGVAKFD